MLHEWFPKLLDDIAIERNLIYNYVRLKIELDKYIVKNTLNFIQLFTW